MPMIDATWRIGDAAGDGVHFLVAFIAAAPPPPLMFELDPAGMMTAMGWTPRCKGTPWGRMQAVVDQEIMELGISTGLFG